MTWVPHASQGIRPALVAVLSAAALATASSSAAPSSTTPMATTPMALQPGVDQSFERIKRLPPEWRVLQFTPGASTVTIERGDAAKGRRFLRLSARKPNHTRVLLPAVVEPGATYRFSARIRATGSQPVPALLALDGSGVTTDPVPGDGQWHAARLYLRTGTASTVDLAVSLGWFGNVVAGDADFDLLKLKKIAAAPADAQVAEVAAAAGAGGAATPKIETPGPSKAVIPLTVVLIILLAGCGRVLLKDKP